MREELEGYFPLLAGIIAGAMLGATICVWIQAPPDCECPSRAAPAVSPLFTPEEGICSYVNMHGYIGYPAPTGTPEPTATPEPTHVFADNAEIAADICANVYDRIIYPATLTLDGAVTMIGTLHGPLVGRLSGYYQACPTGDWDYDECVYVPAENVILNPQECATATPVCDCW